jgi:galactokinase/nucleoside-diphosphate-sugar epimerase/HEAT repeat protein
MTPEAKSFWGFLFYEKPFKRISVKKLVALTTVIVFIFTLSPVPAAYALRPRQANGSAVGRSIGADFGKANKASEFKATLKKLISKRKRDEKGRFRSPQPVTIIYSYHGAIAYDIPPNQIRKVTDDGFIIRHPYKPRGERDFYVGFDSLEFLGTRKDADEYLKATGPEAEPFTAEELRTFIEQIDLLNFPPQMTGKKGIASFATSLLSGDSIVKRLANDILNLMATKGISAYSVYADELTLVMSTWASAAGSPIIPFNQASRLASELAEGLEAALDAIDDPTNVIVANIRATYSNQSPEFVRMQIQRRLDVVRRFIERYGDGQVALVRAPGRINLDGEHIDNQAAPVLPIAIDKDVLIAFRPSNDGSVVLHNMDESFYQNGEPLTDLTPFDANEVHKKYVVMEKDFDGTPVQKAPEDIRGKTYTYIMGVAKGLRQFMGADIKGAQMLIDGRVECGGIPQKAGVSSSSALTVASAIVLASVNNKVIGPVQLAELTCEWERYQTGGGMMDQFTSLIGGVVFLDCKKDKITAEADPEKAFHFERLALPKGYTLVAMNTKTPSSQVDSQYNERRSCTEIGTRVLLSMLAASHPELADRITDQKRPDAIRRIRDFTPENLGISEKEIDAMFDSLLEVATQQELLDKYGQMRDYLEKDADARLAASLTREFDSRKTELPYKLKIRCAYQRQEYQRVLRAFAALKKALALEASGASDKEIAEAMKDFADAVNESQRAAEKDYEISCGQLNIITRLACHYDAICSRLSGKGWGGVAFAILPTDADVNNFMGNIISEYKTCAGIELTRGVDIFVSGTSMGASVENYALAAATGVSEVVKLIMEGKTDDAALKAYENGIPCDEILAEAKLRIEPNSPAAWYLVNFIEAGQTLDLMPDIQNAQAHIINLGLISGGWQGYQPDNGSGNTRLKRPKTPRGSALFDLRQNLLVVRSAVKTARSESATAGQAGTIRSRIMPAVETIIPAIKELGLSVGRPVTWPDPGKWTGFADVLSGKVDGGEGTRKGILRSVLDRYDEAVDAFLPVVEAELQQESAAGAGAKAGGNIAYKVNTLLTEPENTAVLVEKADVTALIRIIIGKSTNRAVNVIKDDQVTPICHQNGSYVDSRPAAFQSIIDILNTIPGNEVLLSLTRKSPLDILIAPLDERIVALRKGQEITVDVTDLAGLVKTLGECYGFPVRCVLPDLPQGWTENGWNIFSGREAYEVVSFFRNNYRSDERCKVSLKPGTTDYLQLYPVRASATGEPVRLAGRLGADGNLMQDADGNIYAATFDGEPAIIMVSGDIKANLRDYLDLFKRQHEGQVSVLYARLLENQPAVNTFKQFQLVDPWAQIAWNEILKAKETEARVKLAVAYCHEASLMAVPVIMGHDVTSIKIHTRIPSNLQAQRSDLLRGTLLVAKIVAAEGDFYSPKVAIANIKISTSTYDFPTSRSDASQEPEIPQALAIRPHKQVELAPVDKQRIHDYCAQLAQKPELGGSFMIVPNLVTNVNTRLGRTDVTVFELADTLREMGWAVTQTGVLWTAKIPAALIQKPAAAKATLSASDIANELLDREAENNEEPMAIDASLVPEVMRSIDDKFFGKTIYYRVNDGEPQIYRAKERVHKGEHWDSRQYRWVDDYYEEKTYPHGDGEAKDASLALKSAVGVSAGPVDVSLVKKRGVGVEGIILSIRTAAPTAATSGAAPPTKVYDGSRILSEAEIARLIYHERATVTGVKASRVGEILKHTDELVQKPVLTCEINALTVEYRRDKKPGGNTYARGQKKRVAIEAVQAEVGRSLGDKPVIVRLIYTETEAFFVVSPDSTKPQQPMTAAPPKPDLQSSELVNIAALVDRLENREGKVTLEVKDLNALFDGLYGRLGRFRYNLKGRRSIVYTHTEYAHRQFLEMVHNIKAQGVVVISESARGAQDGLRFFNISLPAAVGAAGAAGELREALIQGDSERAGRVFWNFVIGNGLPDEESRLAIIEKDTHQEAANLLVDWYQNNPQMRDNIVKFLISLQKLYEPVVTAYLGRIGPDQTAAAIQALSLPEETSIEAIHASLQDSAQQEIASDLIQKRIMEIYIRYYSLSRYMERMAESDRAASEEVMPQASAVKQTLPIVLTGGAGFVGATAVEALLSNQDDMTSALLEDNGFDPQDTSRAVIYVIDNFDTGEPWKLLTPLMQQAIEEGRLVVLPMDFSNPRHIEILKKDWPDIFSGVVIHEGAFVSVPMSKTNPAACFNSNEAGSFNIMDLTRKAGGKAVLVSTAATIRYPSMNPDGSFKKIDEKSAYNPATYYGFTKAVMEWFTRLMQFEPDGLKQTTIAYANVTGPGQLIRGEAAVGPNVALRVIEYARRLNEWKQNGQTGERPQPIFTINNAGFSEPEDTERNLDGGIRDYIPVGLAVEAALKAGLKDFNGDFIRIGSGHKMTVKQFYGRFLKALVESGATFDIPADELPPGHGPWREGDAPYSVFDNSYMKARLGLDGPADEYYDLLFAQMAEFYKGIFHPDYKTPDIEYMEDIDAWRTRQEGQITELMLWESEHAKGAQAERLSRFITAMAAAAGGATAGAIGDKEQRLIQLTADWQNYRANEPEILRIACQLLGIKSVKEFKPTRPVAVIVTTAGKGKRAGEDGLTTPDMPVRQLVSVSGKPALEHVLDNIFATNISDGITRVVAVVSEDGQEQVRQFFNGRPDKYGNDKRFALQRDLEVTGKPGGTGQAVLVAQEALKDFDGDIIVVWGDEVGLRPQTYLKTLLIHQALGDAAMTIPTLASENPYTYLLRDAEGRIIDNKSTRDGAPEVESGEEEMSGFVFRSEDLWLAIAAAHEKYFDSQTQTYDMRGGQELLFPPAIIEMLQGKQITGAAMLDPREKCSVKNRDRLEMAERNLGEFAAEERREETERLLNTLVLGPMQERRAVARWLGGYSAMAELGIRRILSVLNETLNNDSDAPVRAECAWSLRRIGERTEGALGASILEQLRRTALNDTSPRVQAACIYTIGARREYAIDCASTLLEIAGDVTRRSFVRSAAIRTIAIIGVHEASQPAIEPLTQLLNPLGLLTDVSQLHDAAFVARLRGYSESYGVPVIVFNAAVKALPKITAQAGAAGAAAELTKAYDASGFINAQRDVPSRYRGYIFYIDSLTEKDRDVLALAILASRMGIPCVIVAKDYPMAERLKELASVWPYIDLQNIIGPVNGEIMTGMRLAMLRIPEIAPEATSINYYHAGTPLPENVINHFEPEEFTQIQVAKDSLDVIRLGHELRENMFIGSYGIISSKEEKVLEKARELADCV